MDRGNMSRAIVTVGVSPNRMFGPYLDRWRKAFKEFGQADELIVWDKTWPPNSPPHSECHYAFKVHAMMDAFIRGHSQLLWMDSDCYAFASMAPMWERLEKEGHILIHDAPNPLSRWTSDNVLEHFGVSRDEAEKIPLMCGTCWGVSSNFTRSVVFLDDLKNLARPIFFNGTYAKRGLPPHPRPGTEGAMVSSDPRCWGHRSDETVMSLLARRLKMPTMGCIEFIGGCPERINPMACVKSGYDLPEGLP